MTDRIHAALQALLDPVASHRREVLLELEHHWPVEELRRFAVTARACDVPISIELCTVLAGCTATPLVELLGAWAAAGETALRSRALAALENVPPARRVRTVLTLLTHDDAVVIVSACKLLGAGGDRGVGPELVKLLSHVERSVVRAALSAVRQLQWKDATAAVQPLLNHADVTVQEQAIEALVELAPSEGFPAVAVASLLDAGRVPPVRTKAAWALGQRPYDACRAAVVEALLSDDDLGVRCAAARALSAYPHPEVVLVLLRKCSRSSQMAVALACRRALDGMDEHTVLATCQELLSDDNVSTRLETAGTLGKLSFATARRLLEERLGAEREPVVRAALVEALGTGGWRDSWPLIRACVREPALVAYSAVTALGTLLTTEKLPDFAALLHECDDDVVRESVLSRLALYGRTKPLPAALMDPIAVLLEQPRLALAATECLGLTDHPQAVERLVAAVDATRPPELLDALVAAALKRFNGRVGLLLDRLITNLPAARLLLSRVSSLGDDAVGLLLRLSARVEANDPGAEAALAAAAAVEPEVIPAAIHRASERSAVALVMAWRKLADAARARAPLDVERLLHAPYPGLRALALDLVDPAKAERFLPLVVDIALADTDESVRQRARSAAKRLVEG